MLSFLIVRTVGMHVYVYVLVLSGIKTCCNNYCAKLKTIIAVLYHEHININNFTIIDELWSIVSKTWIWIDSNSTTSTEIVNKEYNNFI